MRMLRVQEAHSSFPRALALAQLARSAHFPALLVVLTVRELHPSLRELQRLPLSPAVVLQVWEPILKIASCVQRQEVEIRDYDKKGRAGQ